MAALIGVLVLTAGFFILMRTGLMLCFMFLRKVRETGKVLYQVSQCDWGPNSVVARIPDKPKRRRGRKQKAAPCPSRRHS